MTKAMKAVAAILVFAMGAVVVLAYLWIDRSISLSYARQSERTANQSVRGLELILEREWRGLPEPEVLQKLNAVAALGAGAKIVVKKEGNVIWFDEVRFNLDEGRLKSIGDK
ncbi:Imm58 family immunity protein [Ralstonia solanacearum]|uniref:Imm58 family immunity protein n=1 Tax=Ralstonia solanacearum TaxID=305 RepID=UPI0005C76A7A|nr:Imm58 family immunity protein [Ralstonia solanacearum]MDB0527631.1 immunity protein 58 [Ralstonia solanacearum]QNT25697.1 immunity protein 58 [Ralstonia solanacearum]QNT63301.1 immunity protein 58 [Ralstonia solanacearum]RCW10292.1 hypothetical protein RSP816_11465 [Ralstonia solanacearum]